MMLSMTLALLTLSAPPAVPDGPQGPRTEVPGAAAENVLRIYDVSTLNIGEGGLGREWDGSLLPYVQYHVDEPDDYEEGVDDGDADALIDLIVDLYGAEFEYEGRRVSVSSTGQLAVRGPEGLHERVASLIHFFESVLNAEATLTVDVVRLPSGPVLGVSGPTLISLEEAQALVDAARATGNLESYPVRVRGDRLAMLDTASDRPVIVDYDVEIAQGTAIGDPIVAIVSLGTRLLLRAAPAEDGLFLALSLRRGSLLGDIGSEDLGIRFMTGTETGGTTYQEMASTLADFQVLARSSSFSTFLPRDRALVLRTALDLERGGLNELVILRQTGNGLPTRQELPLTRDGARVIFADMGALAPPRAVAKGVLLAPDYVAHTLEGAHRRVLLDTDLIDGDAEFALEMIDTEQDYSSRDLFGRWMVSRPYGSFMGEDALNVKAEQDRLMAALDAVRIDATLLDVAVAVRRSGVGSSAPVLARIPVRTGCSASLAIGIEGLEAYNYDVEVAQYASTPDPVTRVTFDGLCLWLKPTRTAAGKLQLEVRGGANLWEEDGEFEPGGQDVDHLTQTAFRHLFVNERMTLEGQDGTWHATLGDGQAATTIQGLAIDITVREIH